MNRLAILGIGAMLALFSGCSDARKPQAAAKAAEPKMADLAEDDVILRVNGAEFKKHDFTVASALFDKMSRMRGKDPLTGPNAKAERSKLLYRPYVLGDIKRRALMGQFARENKIVASEKNVKAAEDLFLKTVDRKKSTIDEVATEIGGEEGALLKTYLQQDAVDLTLREKFDTEHRLDITDADVMVVSNRIEKSRQTAAASNALERATLEKALAEIKAGKDFAEVAKTYSIMPGEAKEWAEIDQDDVAEEHVALTEWAKTARTGAVSGILELEDGQGICKVTAYTKEEDDDPNEKDREPPEENWTIVRIVRKFWEPYEPMTRKEIVEELFKIRSREVQKKIGDAIMAKAVIEWPKGTNLFEHVETKAEMTKRAAAEKKAAAEKAKVRKSTSKAK